jgi:hypothetical protein
VTAPTQAPAPTGGKAPVAVRPFVTGTRRIDRQIYDNTTVLTAGTQKLPTYNLDTDGFTAGLFILCEVTAVNTTASTAAWNEDGPFNVYQTVQFSDTNNKPILGPMTGHDLYIITKYGGYSFSDDAKNSSQYSVTSGTGTAGGTFRFVLRVPIEIVHRDGLGALLNKSASAVYKLDLTLNTLAAIYSDDPTTSASARTRIQQYGWMDSDQADYMRNAADPNPPALNTIQYWDKQSLVVSAGSINQQLNTFSGLVRNEIFELRDSNGSRTAGDADFPDPFELHYDKTVPISRLRRIWKHMVSEDYGYANPTEATATALALDNGTYPETFCRDYGLKPGAESRFGYLPVTSATSQVARGTVGGSGAHTLNVFVNYVWPANGDPRALTGGR